MTDSSNSGVGRCRFPNFLEKQNTNDDHVVNHPPPPTPPLPPLAPPPASLRGRGICAGRRHERKEKRKRRKEKGQEGGGCREGEGKPCRPLIGRQRRSMDAPRGVEVVQSPAPDRRRSKTLGVATPTIIGRQGFDGVTTPFGITTPVGVTILFGVTTPFGSRPPLGSRPRLE